MKSRTIVNINMVRIDLGLSGEEPEAWLRAFLAAFFGDYDSRFQLHGITVSREALLQAWGLPTDREALARLGLNIAMVDAEDAAHQSEPGILPGPDEEQ